MTYPLIITQDKNSNVLLREALLQIFKKKWFVTFALAFLFYTTWPKEDKAPFLESVIISGSIVTLVLAVAIAILVFRMKKYLKGKTSTHTFTSEGVDVQGAILHVKFRWEEVYLIKEKKESYLIYYTKNAQSLIDKSQLSTIQKEELNELFTSLNGKVQVSLKKDSL